MEIYYFNADVVEAINGLANLLLTYSTGLALVLLVFAGAYYTTAGGNPAMQTKAKRMVTYIIVGLIIIVLSYAMVNLIDQIVIK